jgi:hypothetical protein
MLNYQEFVSHHDKTIRVIKSCLNLGQLEKAEKFSEIFMNFYICKMKEEPKSFRKVYRKNIELSLELINRAIMDHRKRIISSEK